jgi:hypothetical protein
MIGRLHIGWHRVGRLLALLALVSGLVAPLAAAQARPLDGERAALIALFGANVLCLPTDSGDDDHGASGLAAHDCQLCCTARIADALPPSTPMVRIRFEQAFLALDPAVPAPLALVDPHPPYRPRDPPSLA